VSAVQWDGFKSGTDMIKAGEQAAEAALPQIKKWLEVTRASAPVLESLPTEQLAS
jgi:hypothetical protein